MKLRWLVLAFLAIALVAALWLDLTRFLSVDFLRASHLELKTFATAEFLLSALAFFFLYAALASLSIPGAAAALSLAGGALFGVVWGTVLVSFASSIGATLAFLLSRFLLRDVIERRFPQEAERVNVGIRREGGYYLFSLRLVYVFPYFLINLLMGVTRLRTFTFYWVSQLGMLPGTIVYVNAGTQLGRLESAGDILSPVVGGSLALLGLFPLLARKAMTAISARRSGR